ncbi:MAG TPA: argininosuccinate lyase [Candidatus Binatia bacterium]|nr:argininosuccinate lyase [Candidatus Binatia bacterium]
MTAPSGKMWGGRFEEPPDREFDAFQRSLSFDARLLPQEIAASRAWAGALVGAGILTAAEGDSVRAALEEIGRAAGQNPASIADSDAEDVHSFVESALIARVGELGAKLHTGRSRNEQVATDLRLWLRAAAADARRAVAGLIEALVCLARRHEQAVMPGMTHMQPAQPLLFSHFLLAHAEAFFRDAERLADAARQADACALGSGALAGSAFPLDRAAIARDLGFSRVTANSLDAVGDRDFAAAYLFALALAAAHLSRLAEDFILFSSAAFGWIELPDAYATGSSLMPQKKNPDAWELIRGKTGGVYGALFGLLATLKGLPSSYNRDLQEDKEPVFAAHQEAVAMLRIAAGAVATTRVREDRMRSAAGADLLATEAADYLVRKGVPFRRAHEITGQVIREAERAKVPWTELPLETMRRFSPLFAGDLAASLTLEAALARRDVPGGTAPMRVRQALAEAEARAGKLEGAR